MFKDIKLIGLFSLFLWSCGQSSHPPVVIGFSVDSSAIVISNIDAASLRQLQQHLPSDSSYQNLVSVLQTPGDDDSVSMEIDWPGHLSVADQTLVFKPDTPFVKGKSYLVETMISAQFANAKDIVESKVGYQVKPQQRLLKR